MKKCLLFLVFVALSSTSARATPLPTTSTNWTVGFSASYAIVSGFSTMQTDGHGPQEGQGAATNLGISAYYELNTWLQVGLVTGTTIFLDQLKAKDPLKSVAVIPSARFCMGSWSASALYLDLGLGYMYIGNDDFMNHLGRLDLDILYHSSLTNGWGVEFGAGLWLASGKALDEAKSGYFSDATAMAGSWGHLKLRLTYSF